MTRKRWSKYPDAAGEGRRLKHAPFAKSFLKTKKKLSKFFSQKIE